MICIFLIEKKKKEISLFVYMHKIFLIVSSIIFVISTSLYFYLDSKQKKKEN